MGQPRLDYPPDFLRIRLCWCFSLALPATLAYAEKVRSQFLSLRQLAQDRVFSGRSHWQLGPV